MGGARDARVASSVIDELRGRVTMTATIDAGRAAVYDYCRGREWLDPAIIEQFREQLPSRDKSVVTYVLENFEPATCPACGLTAYFRFHFLGRFRHSTCSRSWYLTTGRYAGRQFRRALAAGVDMGGSPDEKAGLLARMAAFLLGAWMRLAFGLLTVPLQALVASGHTKDTGLASQANVNPKALWYETRESLATKALEIAAHAAALGAVVLNDDARFKAAVNDTLWTLLPLPLRLIGRERLRWDAVLYGLKGQLFVLDGEQVRVRTDARERVLGALNRVFARADTTA
jgi:hypothetical protein